MDVQALRLTDERATVGSEVEDLLLRDLPNSLVDGLDIVWDLGDVLDGAVVGDDMVLHVVVPEVEANELAKKPRTNDLELSSENTTSVDVTR